ncbi:uncharacterized protein BCR38DRAFT_478873 [Pseudomassariella vexata]|uniref:Protein kinase domain-containing protein n=1 Tax=Pseudomassariella vexata TaxID=1141098 RepID=A0A1Y2DA05_9PEZI|nr:uncharacterized protein BCR38DRAFT_478873 [Pseudomassariella vexata]ORY56098.1 hypothetical protein BCR38DRAFT_478873 [Pseudomassariella vexata]
MRPATTSLPSTDSNATRQVQFHSNLCSEFNQYIEKHSSTGYNGRGDQANYIRRDQLEAFWNSERIKEIVNSNPRIRKNVKEDAIEENYVQVLYILVHLDLIDHFDVFVANEQDDNNLPLKRVPGWSSGNGPLWERFMQDQWCFCPQKISKLMHQPEVSQDQILPLVSKTLVNNEVGDGSCIYKVEIDENYNDLTSDAKFVTDQDVDHLRNTFVFKEIKFTSKMSNQELQMYRNEVTAYNLLRKLEKHRLSENLPFNCIVRYYGSIEQGNTRTIILEYARGGNLVNYYQKHREGLPADRRKAFWDAMFVMCDGLVALHGQVSSQHDSKISRENGMEWKFVGIHQDIKPQNILVFPGPEEDPYNCTFKLADFGRSCVQVKEAADNPFVNEYGNKMYGPPEAFQAREIHYLVNAKISTRGDVWNLGTVYSEALVWSIRGEYGREKYRCQRRDAIKQSSANGTGSDASFHNGIKRLPEVDEMHQDVLKRSGSDGVLELVSEIVLVDMLVRLDERLEAGDVHTDWENKKIKSMSAQKLNSTRPGTAQSRIPPSDIVSSGDLMTLGVIAGNETRDKPPDNPASAANNEKPIPDMSLTIEKLYERIRHESPRRRARLENIPSIGKELEDLRRSSGRTQVFLVDNSESMRVNQIAVSQGIRVLGKILKDITPNGQGMKIWFSSGLVTNPTRKSKKLEAAVRVNSFEASNTQLRETLGYWADDTIKMLRDRRPDRQSLYIFTDGEGDVHEEGLEEPIKKLYEVLREMKFDESWVSVHFIQYRGLDHGMQRIMRMCNTPVFRYPHDVSPQTNASCSKCTDDVVTILRRRLRYTQTSRDASMRQPASLNTQWPHSRDGGPSQAVIRDG